MDCLVDGGRRRRGREPGWLFVDGRTSSRSMRGFAKVVNHAELDWEEAQDALSLENMNGMRWD